jgi:hypothetical protein
MTTICALDEEDDEEDDDDELLAPRPDPPDPPRPPPLDPVLDDPEEEGLDDDELEDEPETCCPTARLSWATVPAIGEVRVDSDSDFWASVSDDSAAVTADWSAVSWAELVDDELSSADSRASAESSEAWAWSTWAESEVVSTVASV